MATRRKSTFWYRNGLSIVLLILMLASIVLQAYTGWKEYDHFLKEEGGQPLTFRQYLTSGHFIQATFENWESEFLQMGLFVLLTVSLRQQGSAESKDLFKKEEVDREPVPSPKAPWPVRKGGWYLKLYQNSLSIALFIMFIASMILHLYGSWVNYNDEQALKGIPPEQLAEFLSRPKFWFESFQNWQSEFLSVFAIVVFSIFLRQKGSAQSKPVDTPDNEIE